MGTQWPVMACDLQAMSTRGKGAQRWGLNGRKRGRHWAPAAVKKGRGGRLHGEEMEGGSGSSHMEEGEGGLTGNKGVASFCVEQGREREADRWGQAAQL
jgi:hypothetical protein